MQSPTLSKFRRGGGFTLTELMIAVAVMAALLFFVLPFYVSMLRVAYKTSGVLFNTDALRNFSTLFAGDVQSAANFRLIAANGNELPSVADGGSNHLQLVYSDPRTGQVQRIVGYYLDLDDNPSGPWPVRRYTVNGVTAPNLASATVRESHGVEARVRPVTDGQLFQRLANQRTLFVNANVITPGDRTSTAINSLRIAVSLR
jgi:prepilin-type N-terminal cleavage/methylation domain-containing protein